MTRARKRMRFVDLAEIEVNQNRFIPIIIDNHPLDFLAGYSISSELSDPTALFRMRSRFLSYLESPIAHLFLFAPRVAHTRRRSERRNARPAKNLQKHRESHRYSVTRSLYSFTRACICKCACVRECARTRTSRETPTERASDRWVRVEDRLLTNRGVQGTPGRGRKREKDGKGGNIMDQTCDIKDGEREQDREKEKGSFASVKAEAGL